jgi:hypothetical protein
MASRYFLQIVDDNGVVAALPLGGKIERDLLESITKAICDRGVRFRTQRHIAQDIHDGIKAVLSEMRKEVRSIA